MRQWGMALKALIGLSAVLALFLVAMVGMFWLLDVLPLLGLAGMVIFYAISSSRQSTNSRN